ncbi:hypothetical protein SDC9_168445 [bioreactor metagenome]|uniref:Uncharacterized protein n=1 Tax=bioreactor metagenome TaxID=1076179 RepID=A0A645G4K1_9ZZZZ
MRLLAGLLHDFKLLIRRKRNVENFNRLVANQFPPGGIHLLDTTLLGNRCGVRFGARGDGNGVESRVLIRNEVAVRHDEPRADAADAPVLAGGLWIRCRADKRFEDVVLFHKCSSPYAIKGWMRAQTAPLSGRWTDENQV